MRAFETIADGSGLAALTRMLEAVETIRRETWGTSACAPGHAEMARLLGLHAAEAMLRDPDLAVDPEEIAYAFAEGFRDGAEAARAAGGPDLVARVDFLDDPSDEADAACGAIDEAEDADPAAFAADGDDDPRAVGLAADAVAGALETLSSPTLPRGPAALVQIGGPERDVEAAVELDGFEDIHPSGATLLAAALRQVSLRLLPQLIDDCDQRLSRPITPDTAIAAHVLAVAGMAAEREANLHAPALPLFESLAFKATQQLETFVAAVHRAGRHGTS